MSLGSVMAFAFMPLLLQPAETPRPAAVLPASASPPASTPTPAPTPVPELVRPVAELSSLQFAAGDWVHEKEVDHGGTVGKSAFGSGRSKATWIHKGHHLQIAYKSKRADGEYEARGVVSWDAEAKRYHLDWFDSLGQTLHFSGEFNPAGVLVLSSTYLVGDRRLQQNVSIKKQRSGKILILDERAVGNAPPALYMESLAMPAAAAPKADHMPSEPPVSVMKPTTSP
jgi:Protein of unknown function (DUF1579)